MSVRFAGRRPPLPAWLPVPRSRCRSPAARARSLARAVTCTIQQKTGAAFTAANTMFWDPATDGYFSTKFESDQIQAVMTVYYAMVS